MSTEADVLIVGGGIAGWSAAWFATRAGRRVTVVDEGSHRASDLPVALVNPLRGRAGRLVADGVDGLRVTFDLIDVLRADGHRIDAGQGLHRPLIGVAPEARGEAFWTARLEGRLAFDWFPAAPPALGLVDPVPSLRLREAGWVVPATLLDALRSGSAATLRTDRVVDLTKDDRGAYRATLAGGDVLSARTALWCGGAWGASLLDGDANDGSYKPGSLVAIDAVLVEEALSFGLYALPWTDASSSRATLVGPTREGSQATFSTEGTPPDAVVLLGHRIGRTFGRAFDASASPRPVWRGMRLARLSSAASAALAGVPTLTALGSRGFLVAPLRAAAWARSL